MGPGARVCLLVALALGWPAWAQEQPGGERRSNGPAAGGAVAERQWHQSMHRMGGMFIDEHRVSDLLGPIMQHEYELPLVQVRRSLVYTGSNIRLRRVVHDLLTGKRPISVGAIGGSITHGAKASKIGENDWFSLVGSYLKQAFPRTQIKLRNGALPATPSALMNMCLETYVDDDVDLVFVEYVANDGANRFDDVKPKVYERLLRKLLRKKKQPAVVLLQLMPKGMAFAADHKFKAPFMATLEDIYGAQAQYYDLPWLSFRNALWRLAEFHVGGHNWTDWMWSNDFMHPIDPGMRVINDMVVNLLQQTALGLLLQPLSRLDKHILSEPLPPPMHPGNWEALNVMCVYGEGFSKHVDKASSQGWDFINEGKPGAPKWGFISNTPGTQLRVVVNSTRLTQARDGNQRMGVMLAYLKSYVKMGMAKFECLSGCQCEPATKVDALHGLPTSTIYLVRLLVTQSPRCVIGITLLNDTSSGEHKFKVSGIMMNEYTGADVTTQLHEEQWLTHLQTTTTASANRTSKVQPLELGKQQQQQQQQQPQPQQPQQQQPQQPQQPPPQSGT